MSSATKSLIKECSSLRLGIGPPTEHPFLLIRPQKENLPNVNTYWHFSADFVSFSGLLFTVRLHFYVITKNNAVTNLCQGGSCFESKLIAELTPFSFSLGLIYFPWRLLVVPRLATDPHSVVHVATDSSSTVIQLQHSEGQCWSSGTATSACLQAPDWPSQKFVFSAMTHYEFRFN